MFKSTFVKYVVAFSVILLISFIILTSIVTTTIRSFVTADQTTELEKTCTVMTNHITRNWEVENLEIFVTNPSSSLSIMPLISKDEEINIILTDANGKILLTTVGAKVTDGGKIPVTDGNLGEVDLSLFSEYTTEDEISFMQYSGNIASIDEAQIQICASKIETKGEIRGYCLSFISTENENLLVIAATRAVVNSALWVMLAAVIAVYFITERIIHPLKNMTNAAKSFAKGDFSARVTVYGQDEVAELSAAFNNMAESLDNFEKMRSSFLANVSHDLRTPMTTIAGFVDGISSGAIPPEKHEYYLGVISSEVHRLSRLVGDLLTISRLESGERKFDFVQFDITEMARIILISFEQKIEEKKLEVIFETDEDEMYVLADKDAIHQVLYNLCHNAIKFAREGGKFAISITRIENKKIKVSVFDEGEAISNKEIPLLFDRFYKTDTSRGLDKTGVGLGLYICKTIIAAHNEEIHAVSPNDNGAEFWFTLKSSEQPKKNKL